MKQQAPSTSPSSGLLIGPSEQQQPRAFIVRWLWLLLLSSIQSFRKTDEEKNMEMKEALALFSRHGSHPKSGYN